MKKLFMILMIAFTMMTGLFADVKLLPEDVFNSYIVPIYKDIPSIQLQIAYFADTWEDVYKRTGVSKYNWTEKDTMYCDDTDQYFLIIKCKTVRGDLGWMCYEYPGDGSKTLYVADVE